MSLLDDLKAKADVNGDGKLSIEDLEKLKDGVNNDQLDELKKVADQNGDGKLDLEDVKSFNFDSVKEKLGGLFGK